MESVDNTPRRHIGYHKASKKPRTSHDRSSSCPMYSSPPNIKPKVEKTKVDFITQLSNTIAYLNNPSSFKDNDRIKDKDTLKAKNQMKEATLIKEIIALKQDNAKLKLQLSSNANNSEYESNARHSQDNAYQEYYRREYEKELKENQRLRIKIKESEVRRESLGGKDLNVKQKRYFNKKIGTLMNQLKRDIDKFSSYYQYAESNTDDNMNDINDNDDMNDNIEDNEPFRHYSDNIEDIEDDDNDLYSNDYARDVRGNDRERDRDHYDKHYFDNNTNITDLTEEEENKGNIVLTTEKCDDSYMKQKDNGNNGNGNGNEIEICLNEYEINNNLHMNNIKKNKVSKMGSNINSSQNNHQNHYNNNYNNNNYNVKNKNNSIHYPNQHLNHHLNQFHYQHQNPLHHPITDAMRKKPKSPFKDIHKR